MSLVVENEHIPTNITQLHTFYRTQISILSLKIAEQFFCQYQAPLLCVWVVHEETIYMGMFKTIYTVRRSVLLSKYYNLEILTYYIYTDKTLTVRIAVQEILKDNLCLENNHMLWAHV